MGSCFAYFFFSLFGPSVLVLLRSTPAVFFSSLLNTFSVSCLRFLALSLTLIHPSVIRFIVAENDFFGNKKKVLRHTHPAKELKKKKEKEKEKKTQLLHFQPNANFRHIPFINARLHAVNFINYQ